MEDSFDKFLPQDINECSKFLLDNIEVINKINKRAIFAKFTRFRQDGEDKVLVRALVAKSCKEKKEIDIVFSRFNVEINFRNSAKLTKFWRQDRINKYGEDYRELLIDFEKKKKIGILKFN